MGSIILPEFSPKRRKIALNAEDVETTAPTNIDEAEYAALLHEIPSPVELCGFQMFATTFDMACLRSFFC